MGVAGADSRVCQALFSDPKAGSETRSGYATA
jgi:hypothetical protein